MIFVNNNSDKNYNKYMEGFGERLKELRLERRLTQKELSELIGCAQSAIFYWENNNREPSVSFLKKLCLFFDVSADYLLGLEDESGSKTFHLNGID